MEIPVRLRRRIPQLEQKVVWMMENYRPSDVRSSHKENFIEIATANMSLEFVFDCHPEIKENDMILKISQEYHKIIKYLYRTKLSVYWEKQNGK